MASQFVFIDSGIANLDQLLATIGSEYEIVLLDGGSPALDQMASALFGSSNVAAVHLISHGGPGFLDLSSGMLDASTLQSPENQAALAAIKASLAPEGDILLYGCEVGAGELGKAFVTTVAALTGADVAASTDLTGATALGGNSTLETSVGSIETLALDLAGYTQVLASVFVSTTGDRVGVSSGQGQTITFDAINVTVTDPKAQLIIYANDIDYVAGVSSSEHDAVYLTGPGLSRTFLGYLIGTNGNWSYSTFDVSGLITQTGGYTVEILPAVTAAGWVLTAKFAQLFVGDGGTYITDLQLSGENVVSLWNASDTGGYTIEYLLIRADGTAVAQRNSSVTEGDTSTAATNNNTLQANSSLGYGSMSDIPDGTYTLQAKLIDSSGVVQDSVSRTVTFSSDTTPPSITGPSGGAGAAASAISVFENQTAVASFTADESVTWTKLSGADSARFSLSSGGVLTFSSAPTFEIPTDTNTNNTYLVDIQAKDAAGNTSVQTVTVTVNNVIETNAIDITTATDTAANDTITYNGLPRITFTAEPNLVVTLKGPDGSTLAASQYSVAFAAGATNESGTYTVTLLDAKAGTGADNDPFGTYLTPNGAATGNDAASLDGTYTLVAADNYSNTKTVGTLVIDTTPPVTGTTNITDGPDPFDTDTGVDDNATSNGNPIIQFTGEAGLVISLKGPQGDSLIVGQHFQYSYNSGVYTVVLLDADPATGDGSSASDPFGDYNAANNSTGNSSNTADGFYTLSATDAAGNGSTVGSFEIDTTLPITAGYDMIEPRDLGVSPDDELTAHGLPALTFNTDESSVQIELRGPNGSLLTQGQHYTVTKSGVSYYVVLVDAKAGGTSKDPFGTWFDGVLTGNPADAVDGKYTLSAIDLSTGARSDEYFTIETGRPDVAVVDGSIEIDNDTGLSASDFITNDATQTLTATLTRALVTGERLLGSVDGGKTWNDITANVTGDAVRWGVVTLQEANSFRLKVEDEAGNAGVERLQPYKLDTSITPNQLFQIDISEDTGSSKTDFITGTAVQTAVTARLVRSLAADESLWARADDSFDWVDISSSVSGRSVSWKNVTLAGGANAMEFQIRDTAGNASEVFQQSYQLVSSNPTAIIRNIDISVDSGLSNSDFITNTRSQTISAELNGTLGLGDRIMGSLDGGTTWRDVTSFLSGSNINWTGATLLTGSGRSIEFKISNSAGRDGAIVSQDYTLDTTAPANRISITSISDDNGVRLNDFVTSIATQNVSATLSTALAAGDVLMGSIDGGSTWVQIPAGDISGTSVTWKNVNLSAGQNQVMMRVEDVAGNRGAPANRTIKVENIATLSAVDASKLEGDDGVSTPFTFKVELASAALVDTTFNWVVAGQGRYMATVADFGDGTATSMPTGSVTIAAGQTEATISVPVHVDSIWAQDQGFSVKLALTQTAQNVAISGQGVAYGTIQNDDNMLGTVAGELLTGSNSGERIDGLGGNDRINGGGGDDIINGGAGTDQLTGGLGADTFEFSLVSEMSVRSPDRILDFSQVQGDKIDLSMIDAIAGGGDDLFNFIGSNLFSKNPGELRVGAHTKGQFLVEGDIDGNGIADFQIIVKAPLAPDADAFII